MSYDPVRQMKAKLAVVATLAAALALAACGKEGPPTPPLRAVPAPSKDLAAHQRGNRVLLSFTYPQTTPGGSALNGPLVSAPSEPAPVVLGERPVMLQMNSRNSSGNSR